jgi:maltooligosyltrehalose trehalohydrolase
VVAVAAGRRREFGRHGWAAEAVPDPQDTATFERSKLDWSEPALPRHREMLAFYRRLIALRKARPELSDPRLDRVEAWYGDQYFAMRRGDCGVLANFAPDKRRVGLAGTPRNVLLATEPGLVLIRDSVELPPQSAVVIAYA